MADAPPPFDWKKLLSKENQPRLIIIAAAAVVVIVVIKWLGIFDNPTLSMMAGGGGYSNAHGGGGMIGGLFGGGKGSSSGPVPLAPLNAQQCTTFAPNGWSVTDVDDKSSTFSVANGDRSQMASYGGLGVNSGQASGVYGPQWTSPEAFISFVTQSLTGAQPQLTPQENFGLYQVASIQAGSYSGYVLYYRFDNPDPNDPGSYGLIFRVALASGDQKSVAAAGSVAAAIRCMTQFHPSAQWEVHASDSHGTGSSKNCQEQGNCDDADLAGTYNAQLGTGWAHDSLGRNYNVDVTTDYDDNGPDGPGYYAIVGGTREKLQGGLD